MQFIKGDISSPDLVNYLLTAEKIDTIMHFAAQVRTCPQEDDICQG
jgi:UDP-glucose 4-epimerase